MLRSAPKSRKKDRPKISGTVLLAISFIFACTEGPQYTGTFEAVVNDRFRRQMTVSVTELKAVTASDGVASVCTARFSAQGQDPFRVTTLCMTGPFQEPPSYMDWNGSLWVDRFGVEWRRVPPRAN
jgi:hypothetical protein